MVIRTIAWAILIPITVFGFLVGLEAFGGSSIQSLTTDSSGKVHAQLRNGNSDQIMSSNGGPFTFNDVFTVDKGATEFQIGEPNLQTSSTGRVSIGSFGNGNTTPGSELAIFTRTSGGTITEAIRIKNDQKAELSVREDGDCGIGNVCSGFVDLVNEACSSNCDALVVNSSPFIRAGNIVSFSFEMTADPTAAGQFLATVDPPVPPSSNFTSTDVSGTCVGGTSTQAHGLLAGNTGTGKILIVIDANHSISSGYRCTGDYRLP